MKEKKPKLLVVEDDPGIQSQLKWVFEDYDVVFGDDRPSAIAELRRECPYLRVLGSYPARTTAAGAVDRYNGSEE